MDQMRKKRVITPIANIVAGIAIGDFVMQAAEGDIMGVLGDGLQQGGFERQQLFTIGAGALGKKGDEGVFGQGLFDFKIGFSHLGAALTIHKHRPRQGSQPPE